MPPTPPSPGVPPPEPPPGPPPGPPPAAAPPGPRERRRRRLSLLLRVGVTVAVLGWVLSQVDPAAAAAHLAGAPGWVFVVPAVLLVLNSALHALRLKVLLAAAGVEVPLLPAVGAMLRAAFVGLVLPTGGSEVAKAGFLVRLSGSAEATVAAVLVGRVLELVPWTLLLCWGLAWGLWAHDPLLGAAAVVFAAAFAGVLLVAALLARAGAGERLVARLPGPVRGLYARLPTRVHQIVARGRSATARVGADRPRLLLALLLALPFSLVNCLVVWAVLQGYGVTASYGDVLAIVPAADTLISLPVTVGGVGMREGVFVRALAPWGATEALAVSVALTRWTGELGRAALGGLLLLRSAGGRRQA